MIATLRGWIRRWMAVIALLLRRRTGPVNASSASLMLGAGVADALRLSAEPENIVRRMFERFSFRIFLPSASAVGEFLREGRPPNSARPAAARRTPPCDR